MPKYALTGKSIPPKLSPRESNVLSIHGGTEETEDCRFLSRVIGDSSFFSSPGCGMVQLNTFNGNRYFIITMMVPGVKDAVQKSTAEDLMRKALKKM